MSRKVVALIASHDTQNGLRAWAQRVGFDLSSSYGGERRDPDRFDFHVTLVSSANPVSMAETQHVVAPVTLAAVGFDVLGVDRQVPALKIAPSETLATARAFFVGMYAIEPTFAEFKPHVSLSYAWDGTPALAALALPDMPLVFDQLRVKSLDDLPEKSRRPLMLAKRAPGAHGLYR